MPKADMSALLDHACRMGIWIISDEAYERLVFGADPHADGTVWYTPGTLIVGLNSSSNARQVQGLTNIVAFADMHSLQTLSAAIGSDGRMWRLLNSGAVNTGPGVNDFTIAVQQMTAPASAHGKSSKPSQSETLLRL